MYYAIMYVETGIVRHTSQALCNRKGIHFPKQSMVEDWLPGTVWGKGDTEEAAVNDAEQVRSKLLKKNPEYKSPLSVCVSH